MLCRTRSRGVDDLDVLSGARLGRTSLGRWVSHDPRELGGVDGASMSKATVGRLVGRLGKGPREGDDGARARTSITVSSVRRGPNV